GKNLKEVLGNPLFQVYQKRQPFTDNLMTPCPIIDHPQELRDIVAESGAHPTHEGAETVLTGSIGKFLDELSADWDRKSRPIFEERAKKAREAQEKYQKSQKTTQH
ncbi:MAG: radical SAM protein, partial [Atribacterota bacterium]|nr:radical SAM protein [Atribacterota bacterium]